MSGSLSETFVSTLCMQNTSLSRAGKPLALASTQGELGTASAARRTRRSVHQGVSAATDVEGKAKDASDGDDFDAPAANRREEKSDQKGA